MKKSPLRQWVPILSFFGLISSPAAFAQCENPVVLDNLIAGLEIGFSVDPSEPQPDIVLAAQDVIPIRGFISPEARYFTGSDVVTVQCETDYFLTYLWLGAGPFEAPTPEARIEKLINFRNRHSEIDLLIDGVPIGAPIETIPQDGFNPWDPGSPMAYMFFYWISEPHSLEPKSYDVRLQYRIDEPLYISDFDLEVLDVPKLVAADGSNNNFFGWSAATSGDTAVIGAYRQLNENGRSGAAYVFDRNTAGAVCLKTGTQDPWCEQAKLVALDEENGDRFGYRVAISGDTIIVSARRDDTAGGQDAGSAYVFTRSTDVWTQQAKLVASDGAAFDTFGGGLAFAGDTALIGAPGDDNGEGSVYVFTGSGAAWSQQAKLTPDDPQANQFFGGAISISGDTALFGASYDNEMANSAGAAYVFTRSAGDWTQQAKLTASDSVEWDRIGVHVALSADTAILGANYANKAYVFVRDGVTWEEQAKLTASDGAADDFFGSVALSGDTAVIGADADDDWAFDSGSAYVFTRSGGEWTEHGKFGAPDAAVREWFGKEVALSGDIALITATTSGIAWKGTPGSAYAFDDMDGDGWLHDSDNAPGFYNPDQSDVDGDGIGDVADPCPSNPDNNSCDPSGSTAESIDPVNGGVVATQDGSAVITVPPGALVTEGVTSISVTDEGTGFQLSDLGQAFAVFGVDIGPEGTVFDVPITLVFAWDDADNDGVVDGTIIQEASLQVTKDGTAITGECQNNPTGDSVLPDCDANLNTFTFQVSSLSKFAIVGPNDSDEDGVPDDVNGINGIVDRCPNTVLPEEVVPTSGHLGNNRWALQSADGNFTQAPPQAGSVFSISTADTRGCSCQQIIEAAGLGNGHTKNGCSTSAMLNWINNP